MPFLSPGLRVSAASANSAARNQRLRLGVALIASDLQWGLIWSPVPIALRSTSRRSATAASRRCIDQGGRIVWWCFPRLDGDPIFCRLLAGDEDKGFCDVVLDGQVSATSSYVRNTGIVETILVASNGASVKVTDFAPRFLRHGRSFHPAQLIRRIEPLTGLPRIVMSRQADVRLRQCRGQSGARIKPHSLSLRLDAHSRHDRHRRVLHRARDAVRVDASQSRWSWVEMSRSRAPSTRCRENSSSARANSG